jgi:V/A-type H+-transporting ATPase subunit D
MPQLIKVRPTKIELIKLRRRLALSQRIQKIVKDRLSILTLEFLQKAREVVEVKKNLLDSFSATYRSLSITAGYHGYIALEKELIMAEKDVVVATGVVSMAGVRTPSFELVDNGVSYEYSPTDTSSFLDRTVEMSYASLKAVVELAELQRGLDLLGMEIKRTKRIVNALEYLIIPALQATIKYLNMKFEERDREEKSRLKRVKVLLQRE